MVRQPLTVVGLLCLLPHPIALAWGNSGHRIVCQIALERLTPAGKDLVDAALAMHTDVLDPFKGCQNCPSAHPLDDRPMTFQAACLWADESRRDTHKATYEYHYINVPKAETTFSINRDCGAMDCAVVAIQRFARYLAGAADGSRLKERKALALRFLGHFVGDLHQPLHVGFVEDLGGNRIDVRWRRANGTLVNSNLHKVWDGDILDRANLTSQSVGTTLNAEITPTEAAAWETLDLKSWVEESYALARTKAYTQPSGSVVADGDTLGDDYFNAALPVVREQLKKAGVRLAFLVNGAASGSLPATLLEFK